MSSYRVLIVEDEGLIAHDIASRLEASGHTVVGPASTFEEALQYAKDSQVVLMDIRIDGPRDGIEAAREIRAQYHLPVIFLTAHADQHTVERAKLAGPFGYIVKPMGHASLQTSIEIAMYKHGMERQLEERESWLRTTLSSVADAVVVTDPHGKVILANRAAEALFGSVVENVSKALPGDPIPLAILRDAPVTIDAEVKGQAVEGLVAPVKASGVTIGAVLTLRNVTFRRWQEEQLRQTQKMEAASRLAAGISSEYTGLLATIRKETQQLLGRFGGTASVRQPLDQIQQAVLGAEEITRRLAGLGTRHVGHPEVLSLNGIVRRMLRAIEAVAGGRAEVIFRPEPSAPKTYADAEQLEQAILSLVTLACSGAPEGSKLRIGTKGVGPGSGGSGVDEYVQLSIELSECLAESGASSPLSLELSLAQSILTEYEGLLTIGTHGFEARLPAWQESETATAAEETPRTLLLIEPRESVRAQLHNFFESNGYNLIEADNREEALTLLEIHGVTAMKTGVATMITATPEDPITTLEPPAVTSFADAPFAATIDLVIGDKASVAGISEGMEGIGPVPVVAIDQPPFQAMTQNALLEHVRALLGPKLTFSASA